MLDIDELRKELPKIGDVLIKTPIMDSFASNKKAYPCVVTYVNTEHLWYQVEFNLSGNKFKQNYNFTDDYNDEIRKYWNKFIPGCDVQYKERMKSLRDQQRSYDGKSSIPKLVKPNPFFKDIFEITKELAEYNKKHNTNLSYGQYVNLFYKHPMKKCKNGRNS